MGNFTVRIFAQPNFENVTGIGLHTSFEELNDIIILSVTSQFPKKYFRLNKLCKMSSEYIKHTIVLRYSFSTDSAGIFCSRKF